MQIKFDISDISTYRSELMGWAILWIMMLHFTFTQVKPLGFVAQYGFAGVEIFMMVSGFGLFYSLEKDGNAPRFYKKRLLRIFPAYYFLGIFASLLLYHDSLPEYLFRYTTIGFWTGGLYAEWYIPSIIVLYLLAPLFKKLCNRRGLVLLCIISLLILAATYILVAGEYIEKGEPHFFLLYRIPAFLFGMVCAYWVKQGVSPKYYLCILIIGLPIFACLFPHHHEVYNYKYFSLVFLLPLFVLCFLSCSHFLPLLNPVISELGKASLEVYIIQGMFFHAILTGLITVPAQWHDCCTAGFIILSSLLGIAVHWLIDRIRK